MCEQVCVPMLACVEARGQFQRLPLWFSTLFLRQFLFEHRAHCFGQTAQPVSHQDPPASTHQFWNYRRCCSVWFFNMNAGGQTLVLTFAQQALYPLAIAQSKPRGRKEVSQVFGKVRRTATRRESPRAPNGGPKHSPRPYLPLPYTQGKWNTAQSLG